MKFLKSKLSPFWQIYLLVLSSFAVLLIAGSILLLSFLSAFENSQPIHPAQSSFDRYFLKGNFEAALKAANFETHESENLSMVAEALKKQAEGKKFTLCATGSEGGVASYNVVLTGGKDGGTDTKIATLDVKKDTKKGAFGLTPYKFHQIRFYFKGQTNITCSVPEDCVLLVNDVPLKEGAFETEEHIWNQYLPDQTQGIGLKTYALNGLFHQPTLFCTYENGNKTELVLNEENGRYEAPLSFEKEVDSALKDRILTGMKEYAKYIQDDGSLGAVASYFDRGSMFYKNTAGNPSVFVWDHNGYEFQNEVIEDFYFFDENTLCCHVSFDQVLKKTGREDYIDHLDMTVFVKKQNGSWQIFDRIVR